MSTCAIVIPAFDEAESIARVVGDLAPLGPVIVVDDASSDETSGRAAAAGAIVVRNERNLGYGGSIDAGFREAIARGFDHVVTADGDGQHEPREVETFVRLLVDDGYELAIGIRAIPLRHVERLCAAFARWRYGVRDPLCGLKGYHVRFFEDYGGFNRRHSVGTELMLFALRRGARWTQTPITIHPRAGGGSRFYATLRGNGRILRAFWAMVRMSFGPVR